MNTSIEADVVDSVLTADMIKHAIIKDLYSWGLNPNSPGFSSEERSFYERAIETAIGAFEWNIDTIDDSIPVTIDLPVDIHEAMKVVLRGEIECEGKTFYIIHDKIQDIDPNLFSAPFWVKEDSTGGLKQVFKARQFQHISKALLKPLDRFSRTAMTRKEYFQFLFFRENPLRSVGHFYEAIVAHHVVHNNTCCKSCGHVSTLKLAGGFSNPWSDLICVKCQSTYEIKSKKTSAQIEQAIFSKHGINGGSFPHFCDLKKKHEDKPEAKQFLMLVSRRPEYAPGSWDKYTKVHVAEIDRVLPTMNTKSFANPIKIKLRSSIYVKKETYQRNWLRIPECKFDQEKICREVFDEYF